MGNTPAPVRAQIEERARPRMPLRAIEEHVEQLVEMTIVAIQNEQVAVGLVAQVDVPRCPAFDPVRPGDRFIRNRVEGIADARFLVHAVALT